jgi:hypothetical protein
LALADANSPTACAIAGTGSTTIEQVLSGTSSIGGQIPSARIGTTVADREGVRMWIAQSPDNTQATLSYRVYFELAGKVYVASLTKAGSPRFSTNVSGIASDMSVRYNDAAIQTLKAAAVF